ncbi:MAG: RluA family pseudouridine synthase [bacterium]|nr:RluA family pseudouridine synthase [bacterium]
MSITILYEDEHMVAINKPAGLLVHRSHTSKEEPTVVDWFLLHYPTSADVGEEQTLADGSRIMRSGVVHRLDKETSGVLLLAKTNKGHASLKAQFLDHTIKKTYCAIVHEVPTVNSISIDRPISKHERDFRRFTSREGRGVSRLARTDVFVQERFEKYAILEVRPQTGRTHQIRVHLSDEGYPVVCDRLYAPGRQCALGMNRHALHAASLTVMSMDGAQVVIEAPLPADMAGVIAMLRAA